MIVITNAHCLGARNLRVDEKEKADPSLRSQYNWFENRTPLGADSTNMANPSSLLLWSSLMVVSLSPRIEGRLKRLPFGLIGKPCPFN
jgi:hypothetical protein